MSTRVVSVYGDSFQPGIVVRPMGDHSTLFGQAVSRVSVEGGVVWMPRGR